MAHSRDLERQTGRCRRQDTASAVTGSTPRAMVSPEKPSRLGAQSRADGGHPPLKALTERLRRSLGTRCGGRSRW